MIIVTDRLAFLQLNRGSLPAIQEVGGTSLRVTAMSNPQPPGLKSTIRSSIAFCDSQHEWRVVQYSQIDSIGVSGDKKGLHWYQWYDRMRNIHNNY